MDVRKQVRVKENVIDKGRTTASRTYYVAKISDIVTVFNVMGDVLILETANGVRFSLNKDKVTEV